MIRTLSKKRGKRPRQHARRIKKQHQTSINTAVGKLAIYNASHNQGHSSVIRVIACNINFELNLDSSVNIETMDPEFKDSVLAIQSKHKQAIWIHLNKETSAKTMFTKNAPLDLIQSVVFLGWLSSMTIHTDKPTDSECIVFVTNGIYDKLLGLKPDSILDRKVVASAKTLAYMNAPNSQEKIYENEEVNERGDDATDANNAVQHTKTQKKEKGITICPLYSYEITGGWRAREC